MTVLTQPPSMGDVLKYEVNPNFTRESVTLLAGTNYPVGAVLGRITASGRRPGRIPKSIVLVHLADFFL